MQIIMITLLCIGITSLIGFQIMVPLGKENLVLYSVIAGAVVDVILNFILIPRYSAAGAALGTVFAELCVLIFQVVVMKNYVLNNIKNQEYIKSIETIGASKLRIILKHILPQTSSYVIIAITLSVPSYILAESGLSFLGLGIQLPDASWGNMLREAQEFANILYRPWLLTPGILIFIAVLSFNVLGDKIRDILDPKTIK